MSFHLFFRKWFPRIFIKSSYSWYRSTPLHCTPQTGAYAPSFHRNAIARRSIPTCSMISPASCDDIFKELQFWTHNKTSKPVWKEASDRVSYTDCKTIHGRRTMVVFQPSLSVFLGVCFVSFLFLKFLSGSTRTVRTNRIWVRTVYEFLLCSHPLFFINSFIVFVICKCFTDSVQCRHKSVYDERETWNGTFAAGGKEACSVSSVTTKPFAPLL